MKLLLAALVAVFAAGVSPLYAQAPRMANIPAIELTRPMVDAFLNSIPDLRALGEKYEGQAPDDVDDPVSAFQGLAVTARAKADLDTTVKSHGFGDYQTWIIVAQNIMMAFTHVKMGDMDQQMSQAMAAIENNPQLTPQQKEMMRTQLGGALAASQAGPKPSDNNVEVMTSMLDEFEARMDAANDN